MAEWHEPKSDYVASDQVLPSIFNELANNEKYLKENSCRVEKQDKNETKTVVLNVVLVEV